MEQLHSTSSVSRNVPFLNTKFLIVCVFFTISMVLFSAIEVFRSGMYWENLVFPILAALFSGYAWRQSKRPVDGLNQIYDALRKARRGELLHRITNTAGLGEVGKVA